MSADKPVQQSDYEGLVRHTFFERSCLMRWFVNKGNVPFYPSLMQLRFALLTVTSSQRDLHPQVCAHAGRTIKKPHQVARAGLSQFNLQLTCASARLEQVHNTHSELAIFLGANCTNSPFFQFGTVI